MTLRYLAGAALAICAVPHAIAHEDGPIKSHASGHAPIGVMADHRHEQGEWMFSYRFMQMQMEGNRDGTDTLSPEEIATTVPNRFAGTPMQPPTLRVVPTEMTMDMHMLGAMYGLSDRVTLMVMANYLTKDMDHLTFMGGMGTTVLGEFTTQTEGFGDTSVSAIVGLDDGTKTGRQINLNVGLSLPTGSITETDQILTPMGGTPTTRLPYPMQLGSGTYDAKLGLTAFDRTGQWSYGGQVNTVIRLGDNDEGYALGDVLEATGWVAYEPRPWVSFSGRLRAQAQGSIDGIDPEILAPVQTADPDNHGGETVEALFGINLLGTSGAVKGHRLAAEVGLPIYRNLNGPQLETDLTFSLGWQKSF
ncbi:MAG: transporter [Henriciella sp.]|nr:transporter [Henriciella sp.]